jgi:hypothetical protein
MINSTRLIRIACLIAICVIVYALRPMPVYDLYAQTAAGMYEPTTVNNGQTLTNLNRLVANVEAEMISAQALLDMRQLPAEAMSQLAHHLNELATLSDDMNSQLVACYGEQRVKEMINLAPWATETLALTQVLKQNHGKFDKATTMTDEKYRTLVGNFQWAERTLGDLREMILREMPIPTAASSEQSMHN